MTDAESKDVKPAHLTPIVLSLEESPAGHPCAAVHHYHSDLALMTYLLQDLRALARRAAKGELTVEPYGAITWDVHGLRRRTVICNPERLMQQADVQCVGFFGNRRNTSAASAVDEAELDVIGEFRSHPGIVSYSSVELVDNQWANLVLHTEPADREAWRHSAVHIAAAEELAPRVYCDVRIHNGHIRDGAVGPETVIIETTKYWDYDSVPHWHALRLLPGGTTETFGSPWSGRAR